jgi:ribonuclease HII
MPILIGVDEAGYGPNYGPLVVAATAWRVEENAECGMRKAEGKKSKAPLKRAGAAPPPEPLATNFPDLYKLLRKTVVRSPEKSTGAKLAIADSKTLYKAGLGVHQLERGVLAALVALGPAVDEAQCIDRVADLLATTSADPFHRRRELACHFDDEQPLPLETPAKEICRLATKLRQTCADSGVTLLSIRATLVYPTEFNALVEEFGNKSSALSHVTLGLVRRVVDEVDAGGEDAPAHSQLFTDSCLLPHDSSLPTVPCPLTPDSFFISLDKHGGRNRYAALVQHHFPESWIETVSEARDLSRYRWQHGERAVEAIFRVGCEELLPTALASMTAKYHREVAMRAFNAFWTARLPDLRPTAGYPGDAHRFKADIAAVQQELGIEDRVLWRCR